MPIRNDKSNDSGNEMVRVCSNRTTIIKENLNVIICDSHSRGRATRVKNYVSYKLNGLVKPGTGIDILANSARKNRVTLMKSDVNFFLIGANVVGKSNTQMVLKYITDFVKDSNHTNISLLSVPH